MGRLTAKQIALCKYLKVNPLDMKEVNSSFFAVSSNDREKEEWSIYHKDELESIARKELQEVCFDTWGYTVQELSVVTGVPEEEIFQRVGDREVYNKCEYYDGSRIQNFIKETIGEEGFINYLQSKFIESYKKHPEGKEGLYGELLNPLSNEEYRYEDYYIYQWG